MESVEEGRPAHGSTGMVIPGSRGASRHPSPWSPRRAWTVLAAVALPLFGTPPAHSQEPATLVGRVLEEGSGEPVAEATILVEGVGASTLSRGDGRFVLAGVPAGERTVVVERLGYATLRQTVTLTAGEGREVTLELDPAAIAMPAVVVSATREARRLSEVAASVGVVDRGDIAETRATHPSEIMDKVPGVWVNVTGGEGHMTAIRQPLSTDPLYLYLEDGVPSRSTGFFNHNALYEINLPQAERIEVMKGPANALYGSDAIGGVVNVQTRAPSREPRMELSLEGGEFGFARALVSASGSPAGHGLRADLNLTRTDGWRDGTGYDRYSGTLRWDVVTDGGLAVKTIVGYSDIDQNTAGSSALSLDDFRERPTLNYTPISWRRVTALRVSTELSRTHGSGSWSLTPYVRSNSMDVLPNWSLTFDPAVWETGNRSFGILGKVRRNLPSLDGQVVAGVDVDLSPGSHFERTIDPERVEGIFVDYAPGDAIYDYDVSFHQASPYVHAEVEPVDRLRFTGGLRVDFMGYDYENHLGELQEGDHRRPADAAPDFSAVSPKVGATWEVSDRTSLFGAFRHGFRAPSEGQLFRQGSALSTVDLDPVQTGSFELGARGAAGSRVRWELSLYRMSKEDDILGFELPDGRTENVNAGETLHRGLEAGLGLLLARGLELGVAWSWARHTYEEWRPDEDTDFSGMVMESAPGTIGNVELSWTPPSVEGLTMALDWNHLGSYWMDAGNEHEYGGHDLVGARASMELPGGVRLFLRAHNLTDERYAERATYSAFRGEELAPGLPRTFYVGVEVR